ncbi:MAG: hypothetical protein PHP62_02755 [Candidatus Moranbacteria bacterium]|nr:hypothetical protein [Candidatus Moranbacteria bacterium]
MATIVAGDKYHKIDGQMLEIKRQLRQREGYPFDIDKLIRHLQNAIEGKLETIIFMENLPVWKTILLGNYKSIGELIADLDATDVYMQGFTAKFIPKISLLAKKKMVDLVVATAASLGLEKKISYKYGEVVQRIKELNFEECPAEVAPQLLIQKAYSTSDVEVQFVMRGLLCEFEQRRFDLYYDDGCPRLTCTWGNPKTDSDFSADTNWVFVRRKK